MKKFAILVLCLFACFGFAQNGAGQKQQDSGFMSWVHDAWKTVQDQGKPAAEKIVRQFPKRFQGMKEHVSELSKTIHNKVKEFDVEQKRNLMVELWRMRKSIDLLTLLRPDVLQSLTGLDTTGLAAMEDTVKNLMAVLQPAFKK